jgi:hypothetical protein
MYNSFLTKHKLLHLYGVQSRIFSTLMMHNTQTSVQEKVTSAILFCQGHLLLLASLSLGKQWISAPFWDYYRAFCFLRSCLESASCRSLYSPTLQIVFILVSYGQAPPSRFCSYLAPLHPACMCLYNVEQGQG